MWDGRSWCPVPGLWKIKAKYHSWLPCRPLGNHDNLLPNRSTPAMSIWHMYHHHPSHHSHLVTSQTSCHITAILSHHKHLVTSQPPCCIKGMQTMFRKFFHLRGSHLCLPVEETTQGMWTTCQGFRARSWPLTPEGGSNNTPPCADRSEERIGITDYHSSHDMENTHTFHPQTYSQHTHLILTDIRPTHTFHPNRHMANTRVCVLIFLISILLT